LSTEMPVRGGGGVVGVRGPPEAKRFCAICSSERSKLEGGVGGGLIREVHQGVLHAGGTGWRLSIREDECG